jgi:hypothetical protein
MPLFAIKARLSCLRCFLDVVSYVNSTGSSGVPIEPTTADSTPKGCCRSGIDCVLSLFNDAFEVQLADPVE